MPARRCRCSCSGSELEPADLVIIGSHCVGLDLLLGKLMRQGIRTKSLYVGSMGGLAAAKRGECDIAGIHLLDPATGEYNRPFLTPTLVARAGLRAHAGHRVPARRRALRRQASRRGDRGGARRPGLRDGQPQRRQRHAHPHRPAARRRTGRRATACRRSRTTRSPRPSRRAAPTGAWRSTRSRGNTASDSSPLQEERYDFVVPTARLERPAVRAFRALLDDAQRTRGADRAGVQVGARTRSLAWSSEGPRCRRRQRAKSSSTAAVR